MSDENTKDLNAADSVSAERRVEPRHVLPDVRDAYDDAETADPDFAELLNEAALARAEAARNVAGPGVAVVEGDGHDANMHLVEDGVAEEVILGTLDDGSNAKGAVYQDYDPYNPASDTVKSELGKAKDTVGSLTSQWSTIQASKNPRAAGYDAAASVNGGGVTAFSTNAQGLNVVAGLDANVTDTDSIVLFARDEVTGRFIPGGVSVDANTGSVYPYNGTVSDAVSIPACPDGQHPEALDSSGGGIVDSAVCTDDATPVPAPEGDEDTLAVYYDASKGPYVDGNNFRNATFTGDYDIYQNATHSHVACASKVAAPEGDENTFTVYYDASEDPYVNGDNFRNATVIINGDGRYNIHQNTTHSTVIFDSNCNGTDAVSMPACPDGQHAEALDSSGGGIVESAVCRDNGDPVPAPEGDENTLKAYYDASKGPYVDGNNFRNVTVIGEHDISQNATHSTVVCHSRNDSTPCPPPPSPPAASLPTERCENGGAFMISDTNGDGKIDHDDVGECIAVSEEKGWFSVPSFGLGGLVVGGVAALAAGTYFWGRNSDEPKAKDAMSIGNPTNPQYVDGAGNAGQLMFNGAIMAAGNAGGGVEVVPAAPAYPQPTREEIVYNEIVAALPNRGRNPKDLSREHLQNVPKEGMHALLTQISKECRHLIGYTEDKIVSFNDNIEALADILQKNILETEKGRDNGRVNAFINDVSRLKDMVENSLGHSQKWPSYFSHRGPVWLVENGLLSDRMLNFNGTTNEFIYSDDAADHGGIIFHAIGMAFSTANILAAWEVVLDREQNPNLGFHINESGRVIITHCDGKRIEPHDVTDYLSEEQNHFIVAHSRSELQGQRIDSDGVAVITMVNGHEVLEPMRISLPEEAKQIMAAKRDESRQEAAANLAQPAVNLVQRRDTSSSLGSVSSSVFPSSTAGTPGAPATPATPAALSPAVLVAEADEQPGTSSTVNVSGVELDNLGDTSGEYVVGEASRRGSSASQATNFSFTSFS